MKSPDKTDPATLTAWATARMDRESAELYRLASIVAVATLATEATRALRAIEDACAMSRQLDELLSQHCEARRQWTEVDPTHGIALGAVLSEVVTRLQGAAERLGETPRAAVTSSQGRPE